MPKQAVYLFIFFKMPANHKHVPHMLSEHSSTGSVLSSLRLFLYLTDKEKSSADCRRKYALLPLPQEQILVLRQFVLVTYFNAKSRTCNPSTLPLSAVRCETATAQVFSPTLTLKPISEQSSRIIHDDFIPSTLSQAAVEVVTSS